MTNNVTSNAMVTKNFICFFSVSHLTPNITAIYIISFCFFTIKFKVLLIF